jgi:hypothetical protein
MKLSSGCETIARHADLIMNNTHILHLFTEYLNQLIIYLFIGVCLIFYHIQNRVTFTLELFIIPIINFCFKAIGFVSSDLLANTDYVYMVFGL